jgi:hypothetical protein
VVCELGKCSFKNCTREFLMLQTFILCKGNSVHHELLPTVLLVYLSLSFETCVVALLPLKSLEIFNSKMVPHLASYIVLWLGILRALKVDWESALHENCHSCARGPSCYCCKILHVQVSAMVLLLQSTTNNLRCIFLSFYLFIYCHVKYKFCNRCYRTI